MAIGTRNTALNHTLAMALSLVGLAVLATPMAIAQAETEPGGERISSSTGYVSGTRLLTEPELSSQRADAITVPDKYLDGGVPASKARNLVQQNSVYSGFWVYDARTELFFDFDGDGFFTGLDVTFDADTDYVAADVYARLYLSLEGGPWILYYTTDVFTLLGTSGSDDYTVQTDLVDGYPTGYYDVLIELYDRDFDELVAVYGPVENLSLFELPLEDEAADAGIITAPAPPVSVSSGGGGSTGIVALLSAAALLLARRLRRGAGRSRLARLSLPVKNVQLDRHERQNP
ncbi:MAG: choice-of-anchor H family protein [Pseudomonadota bacterium]